MLPFGSPLRSELVMLFAVPLSSSLAAPVSFQELTIFTSLLNHYVYYAHGIVLCNSNRILLILCNYKKN